MTNFRICSDTFRRDISQTRSLLSPSPVSEFLVLAHAVGPTPARDCLMLPLKKLACGWCGHSNQLTLTAKLVGLTGAKLQYPCQKETAISALLIEADTSFVAAMGGDSN